MDLDDFRHFSALLLLFLWVMVGLPMGIFLAAYYIVPALGTAGGAIVWAWIVLNLAAAYWANQSRKHGQKNGYDNRLSPDRIALVRSIPITPAPTRAIGICPVATRPRDDYRSDS